MKLYEKESLKDYYKIYNLRCVVLDTSSLSFKQREVGVVSEAGLLVTVLNPA